jgi:ATP-dependent helicase/DNAse subunit B
VSGLSAERPISASRLATLLSCPHRYLYENLLGFREQTGPLPSHLLHVMTFGVWLHGIAEEFWREQGAELGARKHDLAYFRAKLRALARERYEALRETYPFSSESVVDAQREELCDQLDRLLVLDWADGKPRAFVDVERGFGYDDPCPIETRAGALFVRGKIDKLDQDDDALLVRDIKTGAGKPRKADDPPDLSIDLQLSVYAQVAAALAPTWGTPLRVGVAYVYLRSGEPERRWVGSDYAALERAAQAWLATAVETLEQGSFVRSPNPDDCRYCIHKPVCAPEMQRARAALDDPRVPRRLALLKAGDAR